MTPPERLKAWRLSHEPHLTFAAAGERIGVKHSTWFEWESGNRSPSLEKALQIEDLTDGAVPFESWDFSAEVASTMRRVLSRRDDADETTIDRSPEYVDPRPSQVA